MKSFHGRMIALCLMAWPWLLQAEANPTPAGIVQAARAQIGKTLRYDPSYQAGDLVTCTVPPHLPHIMIVSDQTGAAGQPLVIHNIGSGTLEEDRLFEFKITGHYRVTKPEPSP